MKIQLILKARVGLVKKQIQAKGKSGMYTQTVWVKVDKKKKGAEEAKESGGSKDWKKMSDGELIEAVRKIELPYTYNYTKEHNIHTSAEQEVHEKRLIKEVFSNVEYKSKAYFTLRNKAWKLKAEKDKKAERKLIASMPINNDEEISDGVTIGEANKYFDRLRKISKPITRHGQTFRSGYVEAGGNIFSKKEVLTGIEIGREEEKPKKPEKLSEASAKIVKQMNGFNIHDYESLMEYAPKAKDVSDLKQKLKADDMDTGYGGKYTDAQLEMVMSLIKDDAINIVVDSGQGHNHDDRDPQKTKNMKYSYKIEAQIDRQPFVIKMKYPIKFDTSY